MSVLVLSDKVTCNSREQSAPVHPGLQTQVPASHVPLAEQQFGHSITELITSTFIDTLMREVGGYLLVACHVTTKMMTYGKLIEISSPIGSTRGNVPSSGKGIYGKFQ